MITEENLLALVSRFDEQALVEVYDRYSPDLYRYAARLLGDRDLAEECVAETFSRFLGALKRGSGPRQCLRAYLYRIAHNWITDQYRQPAQLIPMDTEAQAGEVFDPNTVFVDFHEYEQVRSALSRLTDEQRLVVVLKFLEDWSNDEIANALEKPVGAVKSLQHRGLQSLRRMLHRDEREVRVVA